MDLQKLQGVNVVKRSDRQKAVGEELDQLVQSLMGLQPKRRKLFRLAIGYFCLALFCIAVAFFPWPGFTFDVKMMWVGFSIVLLLIGGWYLDKSNRASDVEGDGGAPAVTKSQDHSNVHFLPKRR